MHSEQPDRRSASKCQGKWPDQTFDQAFGLPEVVVAGQHLASVLQEDGKTRTLMPVWHSSGESRLSCCATDAKGKALRETRMSRTELRDILVFLPGIGGSVL